MDVFSIFKRKNGYKEVPEWASFFNGKEYSEFLKAIENYFSKLNITYEVNDGILKTEANNFGFNNMGLGNVAQVCRQSRQNNWNNIVSAHFDSLLRAFQFDKEFKKIVHDYDAIKKYIGVRLYPDYYADQVGKDLTLGKDFAKGIYAMLVFDLPESIINIQPEQAEKWGKNFSSLFETGLDNIRKNYPRNISQQKTDDLALWFIHGNHFYTPNIVFDLNKYPELIGSKGSLIGIPHRHSVIIYPIESLEVVTAINAFIPAVYGMYEEGPGSVSNNLYWYRDGQFEDLPYKIQDQKLEFFPPDNFIELLNTLA